jgi:hypothetical protein
MKKPMAFMLALPACVLLSGLAMAQTGGSSPVPAYTVRVATSAGGSYQVSSLAWRVGGTAAGGEYILAIPDEPALRGSGCCCIYLPAVLRGVP